MLFDKREIKEETGLKVGNLKYKGNMIIEYPNRIFDFDVIKDYFEIIQIADGGVFSCFENISKPNAEIYHKLIEKYNLNKEESILIDDTKRNIISANDIGLKGILFNNIEDIKEILK